MRRLMLTAFASLFVAAPAAAAPWAVDYERSEIRFEATQEGEAFTGVFERFVAEVVFDPADPASGSAEVTIDLDSARTGDASKDGAMDDKAWFHTKEHPKARFLVEGFSAEGDGRFRAAGVLTLKGESRNVDLPFRFEEADGLAIVEGETTLDRTAFGVGADGQDGVSNEVRVVIRLEARRAGQ